MIQEAYFFGVVTKGHHLYHEKDLKTQIDPVKINDFPWDSYQLDSELLEGWNVSDVPDGRVHWQRNGKPVWFSFCWWDRSAFRFPYGNSGFHVCGFDENDKMNAFNYACEKFPTIISRQKFNLRLQFSEAIWYQK